MEGRILKRTVVSPNVEFAVGWPLIGAWVLGLSKVKAFSRGWSLTAGAWALGLSKVRASTADGWYRAMQFHMA